MQPRPRSRPAVPLLAFPPSPPKPTLPSRAQERPRSALFKAVAFFPLLFIFFLLGFTSYAVLWSLCIDYLFLRRGRYLKGTLYALSFVFLLFGCGGNVWMAYWRGGGVVPGAGEWKRRDEEEQLEGRDTLKDEVGRFVLGAEGEGEDGREVGEEEEREAREEEGLLAGQEGREKGEVRRPKTMQVKSDGTARFCRKCNVFKPDRAHHCSSCKRCVLKMDHHCPWLGGGCVGWANYKFFLLFLLYTGALGVYCGAVLFHELVNFVDDVEGGFELAPISWALAALLGCIFGVAVGLFGLYHLYLASKNRSTIEAMENPASISIVAFSSHPPSSSSHSSQPRSAASASLSHLHPRLRSGELTYKQRRRLSAAARQLNVYDLGWKGNLRQVFGSDRERDGKGERWWEWVMPWGWPPGDGQTFPINEKNLRELRRVTEAVYAEAAGEVTSTTEDSSDEESDEDGPIRRA
ncbi:hypothetical protein JCM8547_007274 [Rhodosporidiobolus lusitaniae]